MACDGCRQRGQALVRAGDQIRHGDLRSAARSVGQGVTPTPAEVQIVQAALRRVVTTMLRRIAR